MEHNDRVQVQNPITSDWSLLDRRTGRMLETRRQPYEGVEVYNADASALPRSKTRGGAVVYAVQEPLVRDRVTGKWHSKFELEPVADFGELVFLLPQRNELPNDPDEVAALLRQKLSGMTPTDYFLPVGSPALIALAGAIAADVTEGRLQILTFSRGRYSVLTVDDVFGEDEE